MIWRGPVRLKLALVIVDQTGVATQVESARRHFQLHGKINFALQPRFDDELLSILQGVRDPASLRIQELRFPQTNRVMARETECLLGDDLVMTSSTNRCYGGECVTERIHRDADFGLSAEPRLVLPA